MSLLLAKNNAPTYDYYSDGAGTDPITILATLDNLGGTKTAATVSPVYLIATDWNYTSISITPINEETGINWELSLDDITYGESIAPSAMDAIAADQTLLIYARAVVTNDGSVPTGNYTVPDIRITAIENPV